MKETLKNETKLKEKNHTCCFYPRWNSFSGDSKVFIVRHKYPCRYLHWYKSSTSELCKWWRFFTNWIAIWWRLRIGNSQYSNIICIHGTTFSVIHSLRIDFFGWNLNGNVNKKEICDINYNHFKSLLLLNPWNKGNYYRRTKRNSDKYA